MEIPVGDDNYPFKEILYSEEEASLRVDELAAEVIVRYKNKDPLFVCLLSGGAKFTSDLLTAVVRRDPEFHPEVSWMKISTYGNGHEADKPRLDMDLASSIAEGRNVIILDDVLDRGITLGFAVDTIQTAGAAQVDTMVMTNKQVERVVPIEPTLVGFDAPNRWLVGMGMDSAEQYRWFGGIAVSTDSEI